ncbi:zinc-binding protein [Patescibacteria group bacterium]|nr:zinc-binding protein [Patescibacteria group bacterium]
MFDVTCSECGTETKVPFEPTGDRPVYCRDCFQKQRDQRRTDRPMYDATCATCGQSTQVPFQPSGDRPVYCREHYNPGNRE